jgi:hypothetical protein
VRRRLALPGSLAAAVIVGVVVTVAVRGGAPAPAAAAPVRVSTATVVRTNLATTVLTGGTLAVTGGAAGAVLGGFATTIYAAARHWSAVVPIPVLLAATGIALVLGALAGLYPALRAARLAPAEALRIV